MVEYEGRILLFAELFLYASERNGVIGVCEYRNGEFLDWQIAMDEHWHLSYPNVFVEDGKLLLIDKEAPDTRIEITEDIGLARPGGNFVRRDNQLFRICQNSEHGYGEGLVVTRVEQITPIYREKVIKKILPTDISINSSKRYEGIHTYNSLGDLEVIDLKYYEPSIREYIASRRTKKVFTNKY